MPLIPSKTPEAIKYLFPNYTWNINTSSKVIYITFDDGPTPGITKWTLNVLKEYNAKATFFCIGANVEKYPEIFQLIVKSGHSIGNHTQHHIKGWKTSTKSYLEDIEKAQKILNSKIAHHKVPTQNLFRPPYGKITPHQGRSLIKQGYNIIMWDVLSFDWDKNVSNEKCYENVISKAKKGSIIVFHDSLKASKKLHYALPKILEYFSKKNYRFESLTA